MPSLSDHCVVGSCGLATMAVTGVYLPENNINEFAWGVFFLYGNIFPDISNFFYAYLAKKRGYQINIWRPETWDEEIFESIDAEWRYIHPYKWLHALPVWTTVLMLSILIDSQFFQAFVIGCTIHTILDGPTHEINWLFWPLFIFRGWCNWWKHWLFTHPGWRYGSYFLVLLTTLWHSLALAGYGF